MNEADYDINQIHEVLNDLNEIQPEIDGKKVRHQDYPYIIRRLRECKDKDKIIDLPGGIFLYDWT